MIRVGGLTPLTTTDYPGCLSAVVFCQGCPWRCGYCHNPHLLDPHSRGAIKWEAVLAFLARRRGLLDAVVFSGGEPTLQKKLPGAVQKVRDMGFRIGLHTSGAYPERLKTLLPFLDWIGMDVKAPFDAYAAVTNVRGSGEKARRSVDLILESGVTHEFRTTVHPKKTTREAIETMAGELARLGVGHYRVQAFRSRICLDRELLSEKADGQ